MKKTIVFRSQLEGNITLETQQEGLLVKTDAVLKRQEINLLVEELQYLSELYGKDGLL